MVQACPCSKNITTESPEWWWRHAFSWYRADITHESNISWATYHTSRRIMQVAELNLLPSINAMLPQLSNLSCSTALMLFTQLYYISDSNDLCRSASARKAEKSTMVHVQPVWRGHICYPSWWTPPQGDGLVHSPGHAGREWMGWSSSGGGAYHSGLELQILPQGLACHSDPACPIK